LRNDPKIKATEISDLTRYLKRKPNPEEPREKNQGPA